MIVSALDERAAAGRAILGRRCAGIGLAAAFADSPGENAVDDDVRADVEVDDDQCAPPLGYDAIERESAWGSVRGKPSSTKPAALSGSCSRSSTTLIIRSIRDEAARRQVHLDFTAKRGSAGDSVREHVTGRAGMRWRRANCAP